MRILYALLLLFAVTLAAAGDATVVTPSGKTPVATAAVQSSEQACLESASKGTASDQVAQSAGCCKDHKGVCGCRAGKIVCCDKSFAAGCTCNRDEPLTTL